MIKLTKYDNVIIYINWQNVNWVYPHASGGTVIVFANGPKGHELVRVYESADQVAALIGKYDR